MTEKRYSLVYYADKGGAFIKNNETGTEWYHDSRASLLEIVNELNELHEENQQLQKELEECRNNKLFSRRELERENKELKEINQDNQDYISSLEEEKNNLQIKLQKIRDYAMEDGEVKQGVIEKVILND